MTTETVGEAARGLIPETVGEALQGLRDLEDAKTRVLIRRMTGSTRDAFKSEDTLVLDELNAIRRRRQQRRITTPAPTQDEPAATNIKLPAKETTLQRRERRWRMCIEAGIDPWKSRTGILPLARKDGVTSNAFSQDLKKYMAWLKLRNRQPPC